MHFHFIWNYSNYSVSLFGPWTHCNFYFHTSQDDCTSLLLTGSAMNPLVSLLFTKPKLSHNNNKSDLWISKDHLVLVLVQALNSQSVILWFRDHSDTIHSISLLVTCTYTKSHTVSGNFALRSHWCLRCPHLKTSRFACVKINGA